MAYMRAKVEGASPAAVDSIAALLRRGAAGDYGKPKKEWTLSLHVDREQLDRAFEWALAVVEASRA